MTAEQTAPEDDPDAFMIASMSWIVVREAFSDMRTLFVSAFLVYGAVLTAEAWLNPAPTVEQLLSQSAPAQPDFAAWAIQFAAFVCQSLIFAAVAVPIHRLVLRDETADKAVAPFDPRVLRFAAWLMAIQALWFLIGEAMASLDAFAPPIAELLALACLAGFVAISIGAVRVSLIFPAVAVDAPAGGWRDRIAASWALSRGRFWRLFGAGVITVIPLAVGIAVVWLMLAGISTALATGTRGFSAALGWPRVIVTDISRVLGAALEAAVLSWNYRIASVGAAANVTAPPGP